MGPATARASSVSSRCWPRSPLPLLVTAPSRHFLYARMILFALIALSLVVLTGWSGQVSLGQAAFAGLGALGFAALVNGNSLGIGFGTTRVVLDLPKLPPALAVLIMSVVCALVATAIGAGALRVRGLLLAVVTFVFALAAQQYLWQRPFLSGGSGLGVRGTPADRVPRPRQPSARTTTWH